MPEGGALINLGELSKPATVLVEKISEAIGGIFRPYQIRRIAHAEAEAEKVRVVSQIETTALERRAISRFMIEEAKKQHNIESITQKALPDVQEGASPQNIQDDWITNFFDKCRLISDEEMQTLWSKVLVGEANNPGQYSKRTVNLISSLDKDDAALFRSLCSFGWNLTEFIPLVYDHNDKIYIEAGVTFTNLKHLDEIGLLTFEGIGDFEETALPQKLTFYFYGRRFEIEFPQPENNVFPVGCVLLSKIGRELAPICGSVPHPDFPEHVMKIWQAAGLRVRELT